MKGGDEIVDIPNHPFILLLTDVRGDLAIYLAGAERHGKRLGHVFLYRLGNVAVLAGRADPYLGRTLVLKFALAKLSQLGAGDEGEDNV